MIAAASPPSNDQQHMIVLYYCYPPTSILTDQLKPHANFHKQMCTTLNLGGRIRVSEEGINGVLSGTEEQLHEYEHCLRKELMMLVSDDQNLEEADSNEKEDPTVEWLDMKYCHLRKDVPVEKQLFDSLSVKITREVVSLIEPVAENKRGGKNKGRARCRQRRKQRRKEKQLLEKVLQGGNREIAEGGKESNSGEREVDQTKVEETREAQDSSSLAKELEIVHIGQGRGGPAASPNNNDTSELGTALPIQDWKEHSPAVHLSPEQWNEKLLQMSRENHDHSESTIESSGHDASQLQEHLIGEEAVLLDARNIYETRVGHFAVPNLETFFPNTRKFSSLPNALNTEEAAKALAGKRVFMYCTGEFVMV
mmetsp:Transcript_6778/g.11907  ORF Transcript_6778/g.11907 Transcript_6778/m.11907 type:complete len:367 (+) Transcript_6778:85-1185(+)